jgi:hypothetical protein
MRRILSGHSDEWREGMGPLGSRRGGTFTERLRSGAAKSLEKTAHRRAEIFAPPALAKMSPLDGF